MTKFLEAARSASRLRERWFAAVLRVSAGLMLLFAGITHLTVARIEFQAQVPSWFPVDPDVVVLVSGVLEILIGGAVVVLRRWRALTGLVMTAFLVAVFPGNIAQYVDHVDGFGLDTDRARLMRLLFEPFLWAWAFLPTNAWRLVLELIRPAPVGTRPES
ncbi:MAG TPA: MauE/DoxX family redox-associated membrane protein [Actinoplanes sp.]|nr:MauE/DoxX family redox-associated membrane protein [Actinoplanes sp.]